MKIHRQPYRREQTNNQTEQEDILTTIEKALSIFWKVAWIYGGLWIFGYCFFTLKHTPAGLSLGDGIFWIFLSTAFAFVAAALTFLGYLLTLPWINLNESAVKFEHKPCAFRVAEYALYVTAILAFSITILFIIGIEEYVNLFIFLVWGTAISYATLCVSALAATNHSLSKKIGLGGLAFIALLCSILVFFSGLWVFPIALFVAGILVKLLIQIQSDKTIDYRQKLIGSIFVSLAISVGLIMIFNSNKPNEQNRLISSTFGRLGLSYRDVTVHIKADSAVLVKSLISNEQINAISCSNNEGLLLSGVDVPWNGLGSKTLLAFPVSEDISQVVEETRIDKVPRLPVESQNVHVLENLTTRCADMSSEIHFASKSSVIAYESELQNLKNDINRTLKFLQTEKALGRRNWILKKVVIEGHSDSMPMNGAGNTELATNRANAVCEAIKSNLMAEPSITCNNPLFEIKTYGSRELLKSSCGVKGDPLSLAECESKNRRVKVQLHFKTAQDKNSQDDSESDGLQLALANGRV